MYPQGFIVTLELKGTNVCWFQHVNVSICWFLFSVVIKWLSDWSVVSSVEACYHLITSLSWLWYRFCNDTFVVVWNLFHQMITYMCTFFPCMLWGGRSPALHDLGTSSMLHAYWLARADQINSLDAETWDWMTRYFNAQQDRGSRLKFDTRHLVKAPLR